MAPGQAAYRNLESNLWYFQVKSLYPRGRGVGKTREKIPPVALDSVRRPRSGFIWLYCLPAGPPVLGLCMSLPYLGAGGLRRLLECHKVWVFTLFSTVGKTREKIPPIALDAVGRPQYGFSWLCCLLAASLALGLCHV